MLNAQPISSTKQTLNRTSSLYAERPWGQKSELSIFGDEAYPTMLAQQRGLGGERKGKIFSALPSSHTPS